jgi:hypothetical protein
MSASPAKSAACRINYAHAVIANDRIEAVKVTFGHSERTPRREPTRR